MIDATAHPQGSSNPVFKGLYILGMIGLLACFWFLANAYLIDTAEIDLITPAPCDLRTGPCLASRGSAQIRFTIESPQIDSHSLLELRVHLEGLPADRVEVDFQGRDMYMGINRIALSLQPDGSYWSKGRLPVCTSGEMPWQAKVIITHQNTQIGSWFDFMAE
jgi:hypothetical protein